MSAGRIPSLVISAVALLLLMVVCIAPYWLTHLTDGGSKEFATFGSRKYRKMVMEMAAIDEVACAYIDSGFSDVCVSRIHWSESHPVFFTVYGTTSDAEKIEVVRQKIPAGLHLNVQSLDSMDVKTGKFRFKKRPGGFLVSVEMHSGLEQLRKFPRE